MYQPLLPFLDVPISLRPTRDDPFVINETSERVCDEIMEWLKCNGEDFDRKEILEHAKEIIMQSWGIYDGYYLAKKLEFKYSYCPDTDLVDRLDGTRSIINIAYEKCVTKWIQENNILPKINVGTKVKFKHKKDECEGEIYKIDNVGGTYYIFCEQLGHVKEGPGTHGEVVNWEIIEEKGPI